MPDPDPIDTTRSSAGTAQPGTARAQGARFVALEGDEVVGYAMLGEDKPGVAQHWMTGVARRARGRGVASALKATADRSGADAGLRELRTQNDVANAAMRKVNERFGLRGSPHVDSPRRPACSTPDTLGRKVR